MLTNPRMWRQRRDPARFIPFGIVTSRQQRQHCVQVRLFGNRSTSSWHRQFWKIAEYETIQHCIAIGIMTREQLIEAWERHEAIDRSKKEVPDGRIQSSHPVGQSDAQP